MKITIWNGSERTEHAEISGLRINITNQHLVLVQHGVVSVDLNPDQWTRVCVDRMETSPPSGESSRRDRRAIVFGDIRPWDESVSPAQ